MSHDPRLYLEDMQSACEKIQRYTKDMSLDAFREDDRTYDAVIRNLEILGEAARNLPDEIKIKYDQVEWRAIIALRNIVTHAYFSVKDEIIWDVVSNKVHPLQIKIEEILSEIG